MIDGFLFYNSFFAKSLSMQWVQKTNKMVDYYKKSNRKRSTNELRSKSSIWQRYQRNGRIYKHCTMYKFNLAEKSKKWTDLQTSYNVQVDQQTKITPIFCRLEWMSHKWHVHNLFPYFFYTQIHCSINKWKYSLNSLDAAWWNCSCLKYLTDALNTFDHLYLVNDTKTKPRQNVL